MRLAGTAARAGAEGAAGEVDEDGLAVGADAAGDGHGHIFPPHEPGRRLARLDEDRDPRGDDLLVAAGQQREEPRERVVGAGMRRVRLIGGGDDARGGDGRGEVARAEAAREHGDGEIRRLDRRPQRASCAGVAPAGGVGASRGGRAGGACARASVAASSRSSAGSRSASSDSTSARRRAWVSPLAKRETVARSHGHRAERAGRAGVGDGGGEAACRRRTRATFRCAPKRRRA